MMQALTVVNSILFFIAAWANIIAIRRKSPRRMLRIAAACISLYIAIIYGLGALEILPSYQIPEFMRWMLAVIAIYFTMEAING